MKDAFREIPEAVMKCRNPDCATLYIAVPSRTECTTCGFNLYWIGEEYEKVSGPKFIKRPQTNEAKASTDEGRVD